MTVYLGMGNKYLTREGLSGNDSLLHNSGFSVWKGLGGQGYHATVPVWQVGELPLRKVGVLPGSHGKLRSQSLKVSSLFWFWSRPYLSWFHLLNKCFTLNSTQQFEQPIWLSWKQWHFNFNKPCIMKRAVELEPFHFQQFITDTKLSSSGRCWDEGNEAAALLGSCAYLHPHSRLPPHCCAAEGVVSEHQWYLPVLPC